MKDDLQRMHDQRKDDNMSLRLTRKLGLPDSAMDPLPRIGEPCTR